MARSTWWRRPKGAPDDRSLPIEAPPEEPSPEVDAEPEAADLPPVTAMLVDDDDDLLALMERALTKGGIEVVGVASDAASALAVAAEKQPDLILLDLHMPEMGGLEALPLLREHAPRTKFVVVSAIAATHMTEAALDAGAVAFIVKGVSHQSIVQHLHRVARAGALKVVRPYPLNRDYRAGDED